MQLITYLLSQNFMPSQIFSQNNLVLPLKPFFLKISIDVDCSKKEFSVPITKVISIS